jgi:hypothetical protein
VVRNVGLRLSSRRQRRPLALASTNSRALKVIDLAVLRPYAVDVSEDLSLLE